MIDGGARARLIALVIESNLEYASYSIDDLDGKLFRSPRSMRLTYEGHAAFVEIFDSYNISTNNIKLISKNHIKLARDMQYPFYMAKGGIVLFSAIDATLIQVVGIERYFTLD